MNDVSKEEKLDPAKPILWIVIPCYNEKMFYRLQHLCFGADSNDDFKGENQCKKQNFICK